MVADAEFLEDCQYLLHGVVRCIFVAEIALEVIVRPLLIALIPPLSQIGCFAALWVVLREEVDFVQCGLPQLEVRLGVVLRLQDEWFGDDSWEDLREDVLLGLFVDVTVDFLVFPEVSLPVLNG